MSEKISGFTVVFKEAVSDEYMDMVAEALSLYKGVVVVERITEGADIYIGALQENSRIKKALFDIISANFDTTKIK